MLELISDLNAEQIQKIITIFISSVFSFILGLMWRSLGKGFSTIVAKTKIWQEKNKFKDDSRIIPLDGERGFYTCDEISLTYTDKEMVISPQNLPKELIDNKFCITHNSGELYDSVVRYIAELANLSIEDAQKIVCEKSDEAVAILEKDVKQGKPRFNGIILAPSHITLKRNYEKGSSKSERPSFLISFYKTDYFSFILVELIYAWLKTKKIAPKIDITGPIDDVNKYIYLAPAFGLSTFLIFTINEVDYVVLFMRSNSVTVDCGKWHFTMNEAFLPEDVDASQDKKLSLISCMARGFQEEIGMPNNFFTNRCMKDMGFFMLHLQYERFELGVSSYVRIKLKRGEKISEMLRGFLHDAQDGIFEHGGMTNHHYKFVDLKKAKSFADKNKASMTAGCYVALTRLYSKFNHGHFN